MCVCVRARVRASDRSSAPTWAQWSEEGRGTGRGGRKGGGGERETCWGKGTKSDGEVMLILFTLYNNSTTENIEARG